MRFTRMHESCAHTATPSPRSPLCVSFVRFARVAWGRPHLFAGGCIACTHRAGGLGSSGGSAATTSTRSTPGPWAASSPRSTCSAMTAAIASTPAASASTVAPGNCLPALGPAARQSSLCSALSTRVGCVPYHNSAEEEKTPFSYLPDETPTHTVGSYHGEKESSVTTEALKQVIRTLCLCRLGSRHTRSMCSVRFFLSEPTELTGSRSSITAGTYSSRWSCARAIWRHYSRP